MILRNSDWNLNLSKSYCMTELVIRPTILGQNAASVYSRKNKENSRVSILYACMKTVLDPDMRNRNQWFGILCNMLKIGLCRTKRWHVSYSIQSWRSGKSRFRPGLSYTCVGRVLIKSIPRGYGYLPNQERPHRYGHGYDMCSGILAGVEFNTSAMPAEAHGCIHACQNPYPRVFSVSNTRGGAQAASRVSTVSQYPVRNPHIA